jgi:hypothetical protein
MDDTLLIWTFPLAAAAHNLEEAVWLPGWSTQGRSRWRRPVPAVPFRFAALVLTILAFLIAGWTQLAGPGSVGHYLLVSYAIGQALNVVFPHAIVTVATRSYSPGLLTGALLVLPSATGLVLRGLDGGHLRPGRLGGMTAVFIVLVLASIPMLLRIGARLEGAKGGADSGGTQR